MGGGTYAESTAVDHLIGGWSLPSEEAVTPGTGDITLEVSGGATIEEIIGGSYVKNGAELDTLTHGNITTTISGSGTSTEFVVGGSKIANNATASLVTGTTTLTIDGGTFGVSGKTAVYELVMGGNYIKTGTDATSNTATTQGSHVTVNDGTFYATVTGGSVAHKYKGTPVTLSVSDEGTSVTINGGTFNKSESSLTDEAGGINLEAAVIGGGLAYGKGAESVVNGASTVIINQADNAQTVINGKVVAAGVAANGGKSTLNGDSSLQANNGTYGNDLVGGGMVDNAENTTLATTLTINGNSSVSMAGGTAKGEIIGGSYVRGHGTATMNASTVKLTGGKFAEAVNNKAQYIIGGSKAMAYGSSESEIDTASVTNTMSSVSVTGPEQITAGAILGGSLAKATGTGVATATVTGSTSVVVDNAEAKVAGVVGGGLAEIYAINNFRNPFDPTPGASPTDEEYQNSALSEVQGTTSVTVSNGTIEQIRFGAEDENSGTLSASVVGGGLANGIQSRTIVHDTNVLIEGGSIGYWTDETAGKAVEGKVVAGGAAVNGGQTSVTGDTHLTMTGGEVFGDLVGGNLVDGTASKETVFNKFRVGMSNVNGSTYVTLTGGTVRGEIIGGSYVRNATVTSNVEGDTHVVVSVDSGAATPQDWVQNIIGGGKANATTKQTAIADVNNNTYVEINGGNHEFGTVIGGGLARSQGDVAANHETAKNDVRANVGGNTNVTVNAGAIAGIVGGGVAELRTGTNAIPAEASVKHGTNITINDGTVNGIKYDKLTDGEASQIAVVGGGVAWSSASATGTAKANADTTNTVIKGGTIKGNVVAGGLADGKGTSTTVKTANLNITGGTIEGSVYAGGAALNEGTSTVESFAVMLTGGTITGDLVAGNYKPDAQANIMLLTEYSDTPTDDTETITTSGGSILIGGNVDLKGALIVNESNVVATIDGTEATVHNGFVSNGSDNTLAFENYEGNFDKVATGFEYYTAGAGSTVNVATISTGTSTGDGDTGLFAGDTDTSFTLGGEGTFVAQNVTVAATIESLDVEANLTVAEGGSVSVTENGAVNVNADGTFDVTGAAEIGATKDQLKVNDGGTLNVTTEQFLAEDEADNAFAGATLAAGATVNLEGYDQVSADALQEKFGTGSDKNIAGIVNVESGKVTGVIEEGVDTSGGTISVDNIKVMGIATNETKGLTVTNVPESGLSGAWKAVELAADTDTLSVAGNTLQLVGSTDTVNLIQEADGTAGDLRIGSDKAGTQKDSATVTLGDLAENNQGTVGKVVLNAGDGKKATLNVYGRDEANFTVGDIESNDDSTNTVNVKGATLNTGNITTAQYGTLDELNITEGEVIATGNARVETVALTGGALTAKAVKGVADSGNITITESLVGHGRVSAANDLTMRTDYNGVATDNLILEAGNKIAADGHDLVKSGGQLTLDASLIAAKNITATNITANKLYATEVVVVDGGILDLDGSDLEEVDQTSQVRSLTLSNGTDGTITTTLQLKDPNNGVIAVGTATDTIGGTTLSANHVNLNGGMLLVDPAWGLASSNVAVENLSATAIPAEDVMTVNGSIGLGQNSYLAIGTDNLQWLPGAAGPLSEGGTEAALGIYKPIQIAENEAIVVNGKLMGTEPSEEGATTTTLYDAVTAEDAVNTATFADNTLLVINGADKAIARGEAAISFAAGQPGTLSVAEGARLQIVDAVAGQTYTIVGNTTMEAGSLAGWQDNVLSTTTDMISLSGAVYDADKDIVTVSSKLENAQEQFSALSGELAGLVNELYTGREADANHETKWDYADVYSNDMGVRFLSRATDNRFLGNKDKLAAAATIESAARMAFAGAVPQMTKMASDSATNSVVNRMGFANPENGAKAMNVDGKLVDDKALGLALWIAPLWSNQTGFGMEAGNLDYGYNANIGGISLGADYTWANNFRAGLMFNIGGGYAESSGDLSETTNSMTFWGVGAYGGWKYENFAVMGDVSYTSTWNSVDQDVDHRMEMGDLEADIQASAISAGLRFEYKLETQYLDLIPHVGARYMSINTWGYDVETNGGTVMEGDGFQQNIWTFPVGITFSKELEMNNDWYFKPSVDFTVIPAAGDIKAKEDVRFTGLPYSTEIETQMMDYFTWQGGVGLEFGNDNMSVGVNYTLQAGQNSTGHGVFGMFRYEF